MFSRNIPQDTAIKVAFFDDDGKKVGGLTVEEANRVHQIDPTKLFYFQNGDGTEEELTIVEVNQLTPEKDLLPTTSDCPTQPQVCGPPLVKFFGGGAGFGAAANAVISLKDALRVFLSIVLILQRLVFLGVGMKYF